MQKTFQCNMIFTLDIVRGSFKVHKNHRYALRVLYFGVVHVFILNLP